MEAADRQRMRRLRLDDADALDELMRAYWAPLVRYAGRLAGSTADAEDMAQESFVADSSDGW